MRFHDRPPVSYYTAILFQSSESGLQRETTSIFIILRFGRGSALARNVSSKLATALCSKATGEDGRAPNPDNNCRVGKRLRGLSSIAAPFNLSFEQGERDPSGARIPC